MFSFFLSLALGSSQQAWTFLVSARLELTLFLAALLAGCPGGETRSPTEQKLPMELQ